MSKKINLIQHDTLEAWHKKIELIKDNGHKLKMLVIEKILANPNISAKEVQTTFFISPRTMYNWIKQYNDNGLEGLTAKNPKGRGSGKGNKKVDDEVYLALKKAIADNPTKKWTGKVKQAYIKEKFNIEVTEQSIAYRMKKI
ncbi:hypothetical protein MNB_SV-12-288 [hydrothermal vent metagenome]|uniref:Mobile element protein n=1 Tax=hydrothermal vent metagenome TaxID=652676 RepID=A0A1W1BUS4_9ZZZZ